VEFPRISPAVITLILNEKGEALLAHNAHFASGMYSLIAGFNEAGEDLETTVAREIREEVNVRVRDIRYLSSQAWPFPNSLMVGFTARYESGEPRPDGVEIGDARWFTREELQPSVSSTLPGKGSIARKIIGMWLSGQL
jgi:NAD+ diphosphatase